MMKRMMAFALLLCLLTPSALAASKATPTPPPVEITQEIQQPPEIIRNMLDIAYTEWETVGGAVTKSPNKYTKWRNNYKWGWCAGFTTWCMLEAGVPMDDLDILKDEAKNYEDGFVPVEGVRYSKESSVGKLLRAYQIMNRTTMVPQPGYLIVYGCSFNTTIHVGVVYDVQPLGGGKYRITTIEGNMSNTIKMYVRDYDMNAPVDANLSVVPEDERAAADSVDYSIPNTKPSDGSNKKYTWNATCFLMSWVPGDPLNDLTTPTPQ